MESLQGKHALFISAAELQSRLTRYQQILIDLGTGDGRFVEHVARTRPTCFTIGIDACRENLREASRRARSNALYLIANALTLPAELQGLATEVTITFRGAVCLRDCSPVMLRCWLVSPRSHGLAHT